MESYEYFARVYDIFMDDVPYERWATEVEEILRERGIDHGLVLDLGCGTGTLTEIMARKGYDMIGIDASDRMLDEALKKRDISGFDILYLCQDMRSFELYGTVRAIICLCDSLNYITLSDELTEVFRLAHNYLDPGGLFIFDVNTRYKYKEIIGDTVIAENREEGSFIWENYYDDDTGINEYDLTLFIPEISPDSIFDNNTEEAGEDEDTSIDVSPSINSSDIKYFKYEETHIQRGYEESEILEAAAAAGLKNILSRDADTSGPVTPTTQRIFFTFTTTK